MDPTEKFRKVWFTADRKNGDEEESFKPVRKIIQNGPVEAKAYEKTMLYQEWSNLQS
jgi:hypothetical protein